MFRGISSVSIDAKGRFAMPAKYREDLLENSGGQIVITVDHTDKCLLIYPMGQWLTVEKNLMVLPNINRKVRNMQRLILGHAAELELDAQGRILLPVLLREYAGLDKRAVLVGQANKLELWDAEIWAAARASWLLEAQDDDEAHDFLNQVSL
ncbi:division/cell wall cluster transcriptional repressor MraZ [Thiothrix lacustris]|uniref:Transcriptional regulator MraZ n=1 Tax=Thiothrix lacustris TaxID=525917 RepID=A0ABY9MMK2_9GAMM|nr:division/cell wall cluster transcriptional repressor MraZ [Thiothrix lacustris]WML89861.1 division/cell wall cluster transcriptional repressor MraZ [Thiothrix lacustris]